MQVQLDSAPPGADARTSLGPGCKTPCSVTVPAPDTADFTVTYTLNKFQPATVPVQVIHVPGDLTTSASTTFDPNPVVARASAGRAAAEGGAENDAAEKAETAQGGQRAACRRVAVPRAGASGSGRRHAAAARARPLIACTAARKRADCTPVATCLHCDYELPPCDHGDSRSDKAD